MKNSRPTKNHKPMTFGFDKIPDCVWELFDQIMYGTPSQPRPPGFKCSDYASALIIAWGWDPPLMKHGSETLLTPHGLAAHSWKLVQNNSPRRESLTKLLGSPPTDLQKRIWQALEGKALKADALVRTIGAKDRARLYYMNRKTKAGGLKELTDIKLIVNKPSIGYYRPDAPPEG